MTFEIKYINHEKIDIHNMNNSNSKTNNELLIEALNFYIDNVILPKKLIETKFNYRIEKNNQILSKLEKNIEKIDEQVKLLLNELSIKEEECDNLISNLKSNLI